MSIKSDVCSDYLCNIPKPSSSLNNATGPLCKGVGEFLYDPANCDPGFWCGCSSSNPALCFPSNDTSVTRWGGHFTTVNETTGETIVLTGNTNGVANKCPDSYYCPGLNQPFRCVDLCEPGKFCPDSSKMEECPEGKYCPVGTTEPKSCHGLEICSGAGQRRFKTGGASAVILIYLAICVFVLFYGRHTINKRARDARLAKTKAKQEKQEASTDFEDVPVDDAEKGATRRTSVSAPECTIDIEFEDLRKTIPNVGTIMRGVSGTLCHGKLTAIMGPSGAGKTTFLTLMSGKIDRTAGTIKVNGQHSELSNYRTMIGYVPQDDIMLNDLTVEENVTHSALMRLPHDWPIEKKLAKVEEILEALEIDHIRDSVVGDEKRRGISGGQRKRVNIAMEMVAQPSLLALDEPTSGLDSTASYTVVQSLKSMADAGANVISVIHQPKYEVFSLFDQVLLLGHGGTTVYCGPTDGMTEYFEKRGFPCPPKANPADFIMDVLSGIVPHETDSGFKKEDLFEAWMVADENPDRVPHEEAEARMVEILSLSTKEQTERKKKGPLLRLFNSVTTELVALAEHLGSSETGTATLHEPAGVATQFQLLFKRACLQRLRSPSTTILNMILMIVAGAVLPSLVPDNANLYVGIPNALSDEDSDVDYSAFLQENVKPVDQVAGILTNVYLFLLIVSCLSVNVLGSERVVFFRETAVGQSVFAYWLAKTTEMLLWLPAYTSSFVLLGYSSQAWLLQPLGTYWIFLFLTLTGFYGFGMVSSLLVGSGSAALLSLVFGIIVTIGFSGTVTAYGDVSYQTLINFWFLFWSTQGLVSQEYDQYRYAFDVDRLNAQTPNSRSNDFGTGESTVGAGVGLGFDLDSSYLRNVFFTALTAFAWHLLVLWTLKTRHFRKHR